MSERSHPTFTAVQAFGVQVRAFLEAYWAEGDTTSKGKCTETGFFMTVLLNREFTGKWETYGGIYRPARVIHCWSFSASAGLHVDLTGDQFGLSPVAVYRGSDLPCWNPAEIRHYISDNNLLTIDRRDLFRAWARYRKGVTPLRISEFAI